MKVTVFLCLCTALQSVAADGIAQQKVSLDLHQVALKEVFAELRRQTGYVFLLSTADVDQYQKVSTHCKEQSLKEFLNDFLGNLRLGYQIEEDYIAIFKTASPDKVQGFLIRGKVTDSKGVPLPGVTVRLEGTTLGVITGNDGSFVFNSPQKSGALIFSFVGLKTLKVNYEANRPLSIRMEEEANNLDEVVVRAYGTQSRREITGAISTVKASDIKEIPSPSLESLLQGRVPGMDVVTMSGAPGSGGIATSIRGFNSLSVEAGQAYSNPLYVIDGVPMLSYNSEITGLSAIAEIDPKDIASIQVLKDASSASLYGSRAANGVILITTKKGHLNPTPQKPDITANFSYTLVNNPETPTITGGGDERDHYITALENYQGAWRNPETDTYEVVNSYLQSYLSGKEYNYFWGMGEGRDLPILQDSLNPLYNNSTNILKDIFRPAKAIDANIQVSGGGQYSAYNISAGIYDETGVVKKTDFRRFKVLSNLLVKPTERIDINLRTYYAYTTRHRSSISPFGDFPQGMTIEEIPASAFTYSTLKPGKGNPIYENVMNKYEGIKEKNDSYRIRLNGDISYQLIKGLTLKASLSMDYSQQNLNRFTPSSLDDYDEPRSDAQIGRVMSLINEDILNYKFSIKEKHNFDLLFGYSWQSDRINSFRGYGYGAPSDLIQVIPEGTPSYNPETQRTEKNLTTDYAESVLISYYGRAEYNYKKKYLASFAVRRDASSKFGENVRWATFPSCAVAYAFSEEKYMNWSRSFLNYAKLRLSWGKSGQTIENPYVSQGLLSPGSAFLGKPTMHVVISDGMPNPNLTWSETSQYDIGVDLDLFDYRLNLTFDWYRRYTDKMPYFVRLPGNNLGYSGQWYNAFAILNKGFELQIKYDVIRNENFHWNVTFNFAKNVNKLKKSYDGRDVLTLGFAGLENNLSIINRSLNSFLVYQTDGYYNSQNEVPYSYNDFTKIYLHGNGLIECYKPGDRRFIDANSDNVISAYYPNEDDRICVGSIFPKATGSILMTFAWKNFDLNLSLPWTLKRKILNASRSTVGVHLTPNPNEMIKPIMIDLSKVTFWQKPGDQTDFPRNALEATLSNFTPFLSSNIEEVSYMRLKSLTLGYTLPQRIREKLNVGLRLFITAENLFTLNNYSGVDPETVDIKTGIDYGKSFPLAKRFTLGLTVNF